MTIAGFTSIIIFEGSVQKGRAENSRAIIIVASNGDGQYTNIQEAIDNASGGDTIHVWSGTYFETIIVNKSLSLVGNGSLYTTINGQTNDNVIEVTSDFVNITGFKIIESSTALFRAGIKVRNVLNCNISNNELSNNEEGIWLDDCFYCMVSNNKVQQSNNQGIMISSSSFNTISDNTVTSSGNNGIRISGTNNVVRDNICSSNLVGASLDECVKNTFSNNDWSSNSDDGLEVVQSTYNQFINCICSNNDNYGANIYLNSYGNTFENCSINSNTNYDLNLAGTTKNNVLVNTTFNSVYFPDGNPKLIVKNYLHIRTTDYANTPQKDVDVKVVDNVRIIYSSEGFNGINRKTDVNGEIKWILVIDRIYEGNSLPIENVTKITIKSENKSVTNNDRDIDMSYSHFEYFYLNSIPSRCEQKSPLDNSYVNSATPELKWYPAFDADSDTLRYHVQITSTTSDWSTLIADTLTPTGNLKWKVPVALNDGAKYQWRVCATDSKMNGTWSNTSKFWVDIDTPIVYSPKCSYEINNTGTINWSWTPSPDTGSGILGYHVTLYDKAKNAFVKDAWTTNTWYKETHLSDGESYTCMIKAKNGAGSTSPYSKESNPVKVDMSSPIAPENLLVTPNTWTSTNLFNIDWEDPYDYSGVKTGAYYYIGHSPPDEQSDGIWAPDKPIILNNIPEGLNNIYLWLEDNAHNSDVANIATGTLKFDSTPPKIEHIKVTTGTPGEAQEITATITDESTGVKEATLFCKRNSDSTYIKFTMVGKDDVYSSRIPDGYMVGESVGYYLSASDNSKPANNIYFGTDGQTTEKPTSASDIDIALPVSVISYSPKGDVVSVKTEIWLVFDRTMDREITKEAFSISPDVSGIFAWEENKLTLMPAKSLEPNTKYTVTISEKAEDTKGNTMKLPYKWSFTTEKSTVEGPNGNKSSEPNDDNRDTLFGAQQLLLISLAGVIVAIIIIIVVALLIKRKKRVSYGVTTAIYSKSEQLQPTQQLQQQSPESSVSTGTATEMPSSYAQIQSQDQPYVQEQAQQFGQFPGYSQEYQNTQEYSQYSTQIQGQGYIQQQQVTESQRTFVVHTCSACQAKIINPDSCPYCGWKRE